MTGTEYQKITGPFKRDPITKHLTLQWSTPELEQLHSAPVWFFTEKVDGTNTRVLWDGYRVTWQGRTDQALFTGAALRYLEETFSTPEFETLMEQQFGATPAVLYGELYGPKIQSGGIYRNDISFALFDVRIDNLWLTRESLRDVAMGIGVDLVPVFLDNVSLDMAIDHVKLGLPSAVALGSKPDVFSEGLVGHTTLGLLDRRGSRISVKVKHRDLFDL